MLEVTGNAKEIDVIDEPDCKTVENVCTIAEER